MQLHASTFQKKQVHEKFTDLFCNQNIPEITITSMFHSDLRRLRASAHTFSGKYKWVLRVSLIGGVLTIRNFGKKL